MSICMFACGMTELLPAGAEITDKDIATSAPKVRAMVLTRLELIWSACEPHIRAEDVKPDPRFIEAGIRVADRYIKLFRLDQPQQEQAGPTDRDQEQRRKTLAAQIQELESRLPEKG